MNPVFGHYALILALFVAALQAVLPLAGLSKNNEKLFAFATPMARIQSALIILSFLILTYAFYANDFSVYYVAVTSNSHLPLIFRLAAVWGGHEGSMLFWVTILAVWTLAVTFFAKELPLRFRSSLLAVMGLVTVGFLMFILFTSNPFDRIFPAPFDGRDLNPLLQDPGMVFHPPLLYMGYVGFSVAFAFAIAALIDGRLDVTWARWTRPWTTAAWVFLTLGIALGSRWAYYELGWGGWWFWDPVENASFMPWLVGTALIHSLAVTEKRGVFKSWTVLLAIFAFSLSLLGTFLVRSGVLTSVHAFASDPERGVFILILLGLCVGGSLTVYALKAPTVSSAGKFKLLSRESFLLANNALLIVATLTILLGTLYPLIVDFISGEKLSVGSAWFNTMFVPLAAALTSLAGIGAMSRWKTMSGKLLLAQIAGSIVLAIFVAAVFPLVYAGEMNFKVAVGMFVATLLIATTLRDVWTKSKGQLSRLSKLSLSYWGMVIAHLGVAITVIGITVVSNFSVEKALKMYPGETATVSGYDFKFAQVGTMKGPNYSAHVGVFEISKQGELVATLNAEKRRYKVKGSMMTEAAIDAGLFRDLYVSMGEPLEDGAWAMRLQVKAFMRWVWLGSIFMALGGLLAILDKRYRIRAKNA